MISEMMKSNWSDVVGSDRVATQNAWSGKVSMQTFEQRSECEKVLSQLEICRKFIPDKGQKEPKAGLNTRVLRKRKNTSLAIAGGRGGKVATVTIT